MTGDYTPTTEEVRLLFVFDMGARWDEERGIAFDRWLAGVERQARELPRSMVYRDRTGNAEIVTQLREVASISLVKQDAEDYPIWVLTSSLSHLDRRSASS